MGLPISQIVTSREIGFDDLFDKKIAIDAFNWIYQFISIIRQPDGTPLQDSHGRVTSHLSGLYYRTFKLVESGIKPIYVFDGKPPALKQKVSEARRAIRAQAAREFEQAKAEGDIARARKAASRAVTINDQIIDDSKKLLDAMGIPWVQAPSEGEALCSLMTSKGDVYAAASQDYDVLLFGSPRFVKNLSITGKRKFGPKIVEVRPEMIILEDVLKNLGLTHDQLIILGIIVGTDYNPGGIHGLGPKKALDIVKKKKTLDAVFADLMWDFPVSPQEIFDFFKNPMHADYKISFKQPSEEQILRIMCDDHEFSEDRVKSVLKKLMDKKKNQSSLSRFI